MSRFWFHFNKPESKRLGRPRMSVHVRGKCHTVDHISCRVPVLTRHRKSQPYVVMAGQGSVSISRSEAGSIAIIKEA